ncbi:MAG: hypothetical protein LBF38_11010 [Deltaproteobacteria bacterium]|nr:hypothetical protein [Deltaproteobacteria bacterium]
MTRGEAKQKLGDYSLVAGPGLAEAVKGLKPWGQIGLIELSGVGGLKGRERA